MGSYTVLEHIARFLANHLPRKVVYFAGIRIWSEATGGAHESEEVTGLKVSEALTRWEKADAK